MSPPSQDEQQAIQLLVEMGLTWEQAVTSLARHNFNVARAADAYFSGEVNVEVKNTTCVEDMDVHKEQVNFSQDPASEASWQTIPEPQPATWNDNGNKEMTPPPDSSSTTPWTDPFDPSKRMAIDDSCIGLAPVYYGLPYLPAFVQVLFHIPVIHQAILSFQPTTYDWGSPRYYWCGESDQIPTYPPITSQSSSATPPPSPLIDLGDDDASDLTTANDMHHHNNSLPKSSLALCELQKLFGFLSFSNRGYGSVKQLMQALERESIACLTPTMDNDVDDFLEKLLLYLVKMEDHRANTSKPSMTLTSPFQSTMLDVLGDVMKNNGTYHLTLEVDGNMSTFHTGFACLGCRQGLLDYMEADAQELDDAQHDPFLTFDKLPRILIATIHHKASTSSSSRYCLDKTIYLDRYLTENKNELMKRCAQARQWRREIQEVEKAIDSIKNISVNDRSMEAQVYDRCDILSMALSYVKEKRPDHAAIGSLMTMHDAIQSHIGKQTTDVNQKISMLRHKIASILKDDNFKMKPYGLQSVVYRERGDDHERYWCHIWVRKDKDKGGQWYRFSEGDVSKVTEAEVLAEERLPFAVTYMDCSVPKLSQSEARGCIPESLKDFIRMDNDDFEEEVRAYAAMNNQDTNHHNDSSSGFPDEDTDASSILSMSSEPPSPRPGIRNNPAAMEKLRTTISILMTAGTEFLAYDPKICKGFEYFLAILQSSEALEIFLSHYTSDHNGISVVHEQESRYDPNLSALWRQYDIFAGLAQAMTEALTCFVKRSYGDALNRLIQVKQKEENWKAQLQDGESADVGDTFPMLQFLGFNVVVSKYGKACLKIMDDIAFNMVSEPIYRGQGLQDAIDIAHKAQLVVGVDRMEKDKTFIRMRHRWIEFSLSSSPARTCLGPQQSELLDTLVTAYLDVGTALSIPSPFQASSAFTARNLPPSASDRPLSKRYEESLIEAATHLRQLKKNWDEAEKSPLVRQ